MRIAVSVPKQAVVREVEWLPARITRNVKGAGPLLELLSKKAGRCSGLQGYAAAAATDVRRPRKTKPDNSATTYSANAKTYKKRKPKYMELYSRMPPHIAPSRFMHMTLEILDCAESKVENTMPENSSGHVRMMAVPSLPKVVDGKPPLVEIHQPAARLANNKR